MKKQTRHGWIHSMVIAFFLIPILPAFGKGPGDMAEDQITPKSVGVIKLGMTMAEARKALPEGQKLGPAPGDEGHAMIGVYEGDKLLMTIGFWENSQHVEPKDLPPFDEKQKIEWIDIHDSRYRTAEGVHVGMKIADVEKKYGRFRHMNRVSHFGETGTFTEQPEYLLFLFERAEGQDSAGVYDQPRVDNEHGNMPERSLKYTPGATIGEIQISIHPHSMNEASDGK